MKFPSWTVPRVPRKLLCNALGRLATSLLFLGISASPAFSNGSTESVRSMMVLAGNAEMEHEYRNAIAMRQRLNDILKPEIGHFNARVQGTREQNLIFLGLDYYRMGSASCAKQAWAGLALAEHSTGPRLLQSADIAFTAKAYRAAFRAYRQLFDGSEQHVTILNPSLIDTSIESDLLRALTDGSQGEFARAEAILRPDAPSSKWSGYFLGEMQFARGKQSTAQCSWILVFTTTEIAPPDMDSLSIVDILAARRLRSALQTRPPVSCP